MQLLLRLVTTIEETPMVMERKNIASQGMMEKSIPMWDATTAINLVIMQVIFQMKTKNNSWCNMESVLLNRP